MNGKKAREAILHEHPCSKEKNAYLFQYQGHTNKIDSEYLEHYVWIYAHITALLRYVAVNVIVDVNVNVTKAAYVFLHYIIFYFCFFPYCFIDIFFLFINPCDSYWGIAGAEISTGVCLGSFCFGSVR